MEWTKYLVFQMLQLWCSSVVENAYLKLAYIKNDNMHRKYMWSVKFHVQAPVMINLSLILSRN